MQTDSSQTKNQSSKKVQQKEAERKKKNYNNILLRADADAVAFKCLFICGLTN